MRCGVARGGCLFRRGGAGHVVSIWNFRLCSSDLIQQIQRSFKLKYLFVFVLNLRCLGSLITRLYSECYYTRCQITHILLNCANYSKRCSNILVLCSNIPIRTASTCSCSYCVQIIPNCMRWNVSLTSYFDS